MFIMIISVNYFLICIFYSECVIFDKEKSTIDSAFTQKAKKLYNSEELYFIYMVLSKYSFHFPISLKILFQHLKTIKHAN